MQNEKSKKKPFYGDRVKSPLIGFTLVQEGAIIDLMNKEILVTNGHLKTSELKHFLLALKAEKEIDDSDMDRVIAWVEQETGEKVDARNLKYDYAAKPSEKAIPKWGDKIREALAQIEIS